MKQQKRLRFNQLLIWRVLAIVILSGFITAFACGDGGDDAAETISQNLAQEIIGTWQMQTKIPDKAAIQRQTFMPNGTVKAYSGGENAVELTGTYRVEDNRTVVIVYDINKNFPQSEEHGRMQVRFKGGTMILFSPKFPDVQFEFKRS